MPEQTIYNSNTKRDMQSDLMGSVQRVINCRKGDKLEAALDLMEEDFETLRDFKLSLRSGWAWQDGGKTLYRRFGVEDNVRYEVIDGGEINNEHGRTMVTVSVDNNTMTARLVSIDQNN